VRAAAGARADTEWRRGEFLGGAITPGPRLLARALASGAARLFEVVPTTAPRALGRDTSEAMHAGIGVGIRGAVRHRIELVQRLELAVDVPETVSARFEFRDFGGVAI
jgi:pantothenate kinase type III